MSDKLFPLDLPVVVATGEYESGKSMLALTTGCPLERVLIYDNEEGKCCNVPRHEPRLYPC